VHGGGDGGGDHGGGHSGGHHGGGGSHGGHGGHSSSANQYALQYVHKANALLERKVLLQATADLREDVAIRQDLDAAMEELTRHTTATGTIEAQIKAVELWRELGDRSREAEALVECGERLLRRRYAGDAVKAVAEFNRALAIYRELGDRAGISQARRALRTVPFPIRWAYRLRQLFRR